MSSINNSWGKKKTTADASLHELTIHSCGREKSLQLSARAQCVCCCVHNLNKT